MARWWAFLLLLGSASAVAGPLDKPSFTATPAELLAIAKTAPKGAWPAVILRNEVRIDVDSAGRRTVRKRFVYAVQTQDAVEDWSQLFTRWRPFFQDQPIVRARVIAPDGSVVELDRAKLNDHAIAKAGDRRQLNIPLPPLAIGSIVEEEVVTRDREPILGATGVTRAHLGDIAPTLSVHAVVRGPVARKLQVRTRNLPAGVVPRHETANAMETWTFDMALPATPPREDHAPSDVSTAVELWVGTAPSWNAVARQLRGVVDKRIAEGPIKLPAELPTSPTIETVRAITAWMHRTVKFDLVGIESSTLVPSTPAATVARKTGDAKDLATLLVASLRQANLRAELALISSGPDEDIEPNAPGFEEFDRVLVRTRVANRDVWIDASEPLAQIGVLPSNAQGRRALVIADDATKLVETPRSRSTDTLLREVRNYHVPEIGSSRLTHTFHVTGPLDTEYRRWIFDTTAKELEKELTETVRDNSRATALERYTTTAPIELTRPFEITLVAKESARVSTTREQLEAYLFPSDTASRFHDVFGEVPRKTDFVWNTPHVHEIENRFNVPDGFVLPTPAPPTTRAIGTMTFSRTERLEGRTFIVVFRLDTGKARMTPAEVVATAKAMAELEEERVVINLELVALELERNGKVKEAIAELERMSKLHPKEALHHSQRVPIYIRAGMGAAARRVARKAVQLEPNDADPYVVLAWALRHDSVGREYGYDHDRKGAIAAYQRARKLDPEHRGAMFDYAALLEVGATGRRFDRDADVRGAVVQWRAAAATDDVHDENLLAALIQTEQFRDAEKLALTMPQSSTRDMYLIAAIAGGPGGAPAAITKAGTLAKGAAINELIDEAAGMLFYARAYDRARALYGHTGKHANTSFAGVLAKIQRSDVKLDRGDPRTAAGQALHVAVDLAWPIDAFWDAELARIWREAQRALGRTLAAVNHAGLEDLARSAGVQVEGGAGGPWRASAALTTEPIYVVRDRGVAKVIGWAGHTDVVGGEVLRALARKDEATAFQLLDWVLKDAAAKPAGKVLGTLWANTRTKEAAQLAGAVISGPKLDAAIPFLRDCRTIDTRIKKLCSSLLGMHLATTRTPKLLEDHARALLAADPADAEGELVLARALALGRKFTDAQRILDARLTAQPSDEDARRTKALVLTYEGKFADAIQIHETTGWGARVAEDLNQAAWLRLVAMLDLDKALAAARKSVEMGGSDMAKGSHLHTLAAIEIELGHPTAANTAVLEAMAVRWRVRPEPGDWYIYGRIAEHLGLTTDAIDAYRRVTPNANRALLPRVESYDLAQRRLKRLRP